MRLKINTGWITTLILLSLRASVSFDTRKRVDEMFTKDNETDNECPILTVSPSCEDHYYQIWNGKGTVIFSGSYNGTNYSSCYNPDECYTLQFVTNADADDCVYEVVMNESILDQGNFTYHQDDATKQITRAGNCTNSSEGDQELYVFTSADYVGNVTYSFYRPGQEIAHGYVQAGNYEVLNMNASNCNIFVSDTVSHVEYFIVKNGEIIAYDALNKKYKMFGSCDICLGQSIRIWNNQIDNTFFYNLTENGFFIDSWSVMTEELLCIDGNKCYTLTGDGSATYFFLNDNEIYDSALSTDTYNINSCEKICDSMPILSATNRGKDIVTHLATISGMNALVDVTTDQYKAACWIIHDDIRNLTVSSPNLVQRYVLGLFYFLSGRSLLLTYNNRL